MHLAYGPSATKIRWTARRRSRGALAVLAPVAVVAALALLSTGCSSARTAAPAIRPAQRRSVSARPAPPLPVAENQRRGTRDWRIRHRGPQNAIEGFTDKVSVLPGRRFRLFVSTTARRWRVEAFRMGWYHGAQARRVWESDWMPGRRQPGPRVARRTNTVTAPWRAPRTVSTAGWPTGAYLLRLDSSSGAQRYVPITVRSPSTAGKMVLLGDVTTWQAYNRWGGYDLYEGPGGFADRSRAVSFNRPYEHNSRDSGAAWFLSYDQSAIALAEKIGVRLAYETDVDIDQNPRLLAGARAVISLGHDEYYSARMRVRLTAARSAGTNIAFLGANAVFRHIRFASSRFGRDRVVICYKVATEDPLYGAHNRDTTQNWREPPFPRPESVLTGVFYQCNPVSARYVVYDPRSWIFAGTQARKGESFAGLVGPEYDRVDLAVPVPRPIDVLAHSPVTCHGVVDHSDSVYYTVRSGAGVFASGTMRWVCAMRGTACGHGVTNAARRFVDTATTNVLRAFAAGPAGLTHPARGNLARVKPAGATAVSGPD